MKQILFLALLSYSIPASAQLFVDSKKYTAEELVMDFFNGACVDIISVEHYGDPQQKTFFEGSQSGLGVNAGIILTTGDASVAVGPNDNAGVSGGYGTEYPPNTSAFSQFLQSIGGASFDWSVLRITLVPHIDSLGFKYVFGSEEYCEYVGSQFNDAFGFLISGPGISGVENIAMIPNASVPVSINNVNHLINTDFYRNNMPVDTNFNYCGQSPSNDPMTQWVQYDGTTTVLTASATVIPDSTYEVWIGISDIGDGVWDSGIFLSIESLCGDSLLEPVAGFQAVTNGNTVTFNNGTKYATAWHWDFGDGATSSERFPKHTYANLDQPYTVQLVATNYCCTDTTYTIVGGMSATDAPEQPACRVFPTQFNDLLTVELPGEVRGARLQLTDVAGKIVLQQSINEKAVLNTGALPGGTYILEISASNGWHWVYRVFK
ncbi:MAG: choice-of-anchor L domain-containing protein [Lewinellaceae bacterium]|nr:choice-of-anchor L domain-containing protein [Lewinellaceae bacterium]